MRWQDGQKETVKEQLDANDKTLIMSYEISKKKAKAFCFGLFNDRCVLIACTVHLTVIYAKPST